MNNFSLQQLIEIIVDKDGFSENEIELARAKFEIRNDDYWSLHSVRKQYIENELEQYKQQLRSRNTVEITINPDCSKFLEDFFRELEKSKEFRGYPGLLSKNIDQIADELFAIHTDEPDYLRRCYKFPGERPPTFYPTPFAISKDRNIKIKYVPSTWMTESFRQNIYHNCPRSINIFPFWSLNIIRNLKEFFLLTNLKQAQRAYDIHRFVLVIAVESAASQSQTIKMIADDFFSFVYKIGQYLCYIKFDLLFYDYSDNGKVWNEKEKIMQRAISTLEI